jgi:hypothetical protein
MQIKEVIESVLKVSSLIIVLNVFDIVTRKLMPHFEGEKGEICRMDLPGPTTSVGTRTDYSVGPWDYLTCAARYLMA